MTTTQLPANFRRVDLVLAREPEHPEGDRSERYLLIAPLQQDGRRDPDTWRDHRDHCRVVRHHDGVTAIGHLVYGGHGQWTFHYDIEGKADDESGYRLAGEHLVAGEYISIRRDDEDHPYRVSAVAPLR